MIYFEDNFPGWYGGVNFKKAVTMASTLSVTGATTLGAVTVSSITNTGTSVGNKKSVVNIGNVATYAPTAAQSGTLFTLGRAAGTTVTLPAASVGLTYEFLVITSVTSNSYKIITHTIASEFVQGIDTIGYSTLTDVEMFAGDGASHVSFNMNGTTSGGLIGTKITCNCLSTTLWDISAINFGSGTVVTSYATS